MKILFFGDIMGKTGRRAVAQALPKLREELQPDLVMANAENIAHGVGVTIATIQEMLDAGVEFFTSGNHVFDKPEAKEAFAKWPQRIIRPANLPPELPGAGMQVIPVKGTPVLIVNLLGRVFMEKQFDQGAIGNPFLALNEILAKIGERAKIRILDFHAEATSEKRGMGFWADGRMSAVFGTHTHIPTADAQILPQGTGYLTDAGMVGAAQSIIGVEREKALNRLAAEDESSKKISLEVAETDEYEMCYLVLEIDEATGKCQNINSYRKVFQKS